MYLDNNVVSMLIMKNSDDKLLGRALLWQFDDVKVMDRIYTINDEDYQYYFMKWAEDNNFIYKKRQNWSNTLQFIKDGKEIESKLSIQLSNWDYSYYPYLDTFKWFDRSSGKIFNYKPDYFTDKIEKFCLLMSADGSFLNTDSLEFDSITKDWHHQGNLIWIDYCGIYTQRENTNYCEILDTFILKRDSQYSEELRDYIFNDISKMDSKLIEKRKDYIKRVEEQEEIQKIRMSQRMKELNIESSLISSLGLEQFILNQIQNSEPEVTV